MKYLFGFRVQAGPARPDVIQSSCPSVLILMPETSSVYVAIYLKYAVISDTIGPLRWSARKQWLDIFLSSTAG